MRLSRSAFKVMLSSFLLVLLSIHSETLQAASMPAKTASSGAVQYSHWQDLPPGVLKQQFEYGNKLINNLNIVALQDNKPVLIRGGGFTPANLDWLVKTMGVRTVIDLRGHFDDDKTRQVIVRSPELMAKYKKENALSQLKNLSPEGVKTYLSTLSKQIGAPVQYLNLKAEDPAILGVLDAASPQKPLAMFCQYGVNRSGTAWASMAANRGWTLEKASNAFGIPKPDGGILNQRDITYGYRLRQAHPVKKTAN